MSTTLPEIRVEVDKVRLDFLEEATLESLQDALRDIEPHVIHYTGHGAYGRLCSRCGWLNRPRTDACEGCRNDLEKVDPTSYLALEDDEGRARNVGTQDLAPLLRGARKLRFVFLSSCQGARTNEFNAFAGVATGLLDAQIPAVLAMQFSILDESAIALAKEFYTALGRGDALEIALSEARLAMKNRADGPGNDWGIPALYLRGHNLRLINPDARVEKIETTRRLDIGGLPLPRGFVGRKEERRGGDSL
jgi:CHAT domain-containing protein